MKKVFYFLTITLFAINANAQVITYSPLQPVSNDSITIVFNANQGNGALTGADSVWIHTGVITDRSSYSGDWRYKKRSGYER